MTEPVDYSVLTSPGDLTTLLRRSADGDEKAFAAVYDATAPRAYGLAVRLLHDRPRAEEVTRETYLYLWTHSARFDPTRGSAMSWILGAAHRRAVCLVRSSGLSPGPCHTEDSLAGLTSDESRAVALAYFGGHTRTEVARLCGIAPDTATGRIRDGLLRLGARS